MFNDDFDLWGLEDQLATGELAYKYGGTNYGDWQTPGFQEFQFDPESWNFQDIYTGSSTIPMYDQPAQVDIPGWDWKTHLGGFQDSEQFNIQPFTSSPMLSDIYNQPQQTSWEPMQYNPPNISFDPSWSGTTDINSVLSNPGFQSTNETMIGSEEQPSTLDNIINTINKAGGSVSDFFGKTGSGLLPLLFLGSGLASTLSANKMSGTMSDIAQREQAKEDENQALLRQFLSSGFVPTGPDPSEYQQGNFVNWQPTDVLERYRAAIDDPRYGLQEYMDAEGGTRAEAAARKAAKSGRTGLNALTNLIAMRDYLSNGRKTNLQNLYQEAGIAAQQDQARLQAAIQSANAQIQANSQRYNTDSQRYISQLNNMYNAANTGNGAAAAIAAAQASGSQFNPILNALAQYLGQRGTQ